MRLATAAPLVLSSLVSSLLLVACESTHRAAPTRDGPPFAEAFGAPDGLLTAEDVAATRALLETVRLPDTDAHHDALVAAARAAGPIDAEHLLLLTESVAGYDFTRRASVTIVTNGDAQVSIDLGAAGVVRPARGTGPRAEVLDAILTAGCAKLDGAVTADEAGRLLSRTQGAAALAAVADRVLPDVDDGTPAALRELLGEIDDGAARRALVLERLVPAGGLEGERAHAAVDAMPFDDGRRAVVEAVAVRRDVIALDDALRWMDAMSFDAGRSEVLAACADRLGPVDADGLRRAVAKMSFDAGRLDVVETLAPRLGDVTFDEVIGAVERFSFDDGREKAIAALCGASALRVHASELPRACAMASFDAGRLAIVRRLAPRLVDGVDASTAHLLIGEMSFDDGRVEMVAILRDHLELLPAEDREALCERMSFDAGEARARELLGLGG